MQNATKKYLLYFAQELVDFRRAEMESIFKLNNLALNFAQKLENREQPYWIINLNSEMEAKKIAQRSVSLRFILELWSNSDKPAKFHQDLKTYVQNYQVSDHFAKPFRISVDTYNKHIKQREKVEKIETLDYLPMNGPVNLKNPEVVWWYIEYYGLDTVNVPTEPDQIMFGRWIADGQRNMIKEISLKTRKFIGNTSMDPQLSLLMANQALCQKGDLVLDPFVGTGSMLVAAAKFGSFVLGSDIDYLMLMGNSRPSRITQKVREKDENILSNLKQYNCSDKYVDVIVSDFSNCVWSDTICFDAIITDPPYGIREAMSKIEAKSSKKATALTEDAVHFPSTSEYKLSSLYGDLLTFSAKFLKMGGRLVCWIPFHKEHFHDDFIPKHDCLNLVAKSEQMLCGKTARMLLTYEKIADFKSNCVVINDSLDNINFREKYFSQGEGTREERKLIKHQIREKGKQEALKRGKVLDEHGNVKKKY